MPEAVHTRATVLPGGRIEITDPTLPEGETVDVMLLLPPAQRRRSMRELIESFPPGPRAVATWEEYERHLKEERDAWDR